MPRLSIAVILLTYGLWLAGAAAGTATLLEHVDADGTREQRVERRDIPHALRWTMARVDLSRLRFDPTSAPLHLFPEDEPIVVNFVDVERRGNDFTLYGVAVDDPQSLVLLTVVDGFIDGTVLYRDRMVRLQATRSRLVRVLEVDRNSFNDFGDDAEPPPDFDPEPPHFDRRFDAFDKPWFKDLFRVDVLVAFTQQVLFEYGGGIHATIQHNIDMTNLNFYASGIGARLRLVHTEFEAYNEAENFPLRHIAANVHGHLKTQNDGLLDEIHTQRDAHAADIVVLFTKWNHECGSFRFLPPPALPSFDYEGPAGRANMNFSNPLPAADEAFAVVDVDCAITSYLFSHEVGHILGADHDADAEAPAKNPASYARGFVHITPSVKSRSIMSYPTACGTLGLNCPVAPYYSNPNLYPYGVPFGSPGKADNRRIINELTWYVSGFR